MSPPDSFSDCTDDEKTIVRPTPGRRKSRISMRPSKQTMAAPESESALPRSEVKASNLLVTNADSLLSLVPRLRNLPVHKAVNELHKRLSGEIEDFKNRLLEEGVPHKQVDTAKCLLCATIDEAVLNTPWGNDSGWAHKSLSSLFCGKIDLGDEFFQILARLRQQPEQNVNLLELTYLCLSLGFEGKYRYLNTGPHALEKEREDLYLSIQRIKGDAQPDLSGHWQGLRELRNPLIRHVPLWVMAGVVGVLLMLVYLWFAFAIRSNSDRAYDKLNTMSQNVEKTRPEQIIRPIQVQKKPTFMVDRFKVLLADEIKQNKVAVVDGPILRILNSFSSGSARIRKEYLPMMDKIAQELHTETARAVVIGHTDNVKPNLSARFKSNWHLSMARAENVANILNDRGSFGKRISFEGMADKEPIAANTTQTGQARNRRIDIHIR